MYNQDIQDALERFHETKPKSWFDRLISIVKRFVVSNKTTKQQNNIC